MSTKDRNYYLALTRDRFYNLNEIVKKAVKAKDAYRARLVELENETHKSTYTPEHLTALRGEAKQELTLKNAALYEEFGPRLDDLRNALSEAHTLLNLESPALSNALKMIELAGPGLGFETINQINSQFAFDQSALKALQAVYKARGVVYDGGLDRQIYNLEDAITAIGNYAENALKGDGSLNALAGTIGKVASLEGFEFESTPDPVGFEEAARRGAGLTQ